MDILAWAKGFKEKIEQEEKARKDNPFAQDLYKTALQLLKE